MGVLCYLLIFLLFLANTSAQQCTINRFQASITDIVASTEATETFTINSTYYNCLSRSSISDYYSSMSVSILYIRSDDPNNICEVFYHLQCIDFVWEITERQSTALRDNNTIYAENCNGQTMNDYSG